MQFSTQNFSGQFSPSPNVKSCVTLHLLKMERGLGGEVKRKRFQAPRSLHKKRTPEKGGG